MSSRNLKKVEEDEPKKEEKRTIIDIYDEEFFINLKLAKNMLNEISSVSDKAICRKWLARLCHLKSTDPVVKKNRNEFFQYFMQLLNLYMQRQRTIAVEDTGNEKDEGCGCKKDYLCKWSPDKKTYIAMQPLPGKGVMIYMAVTKDPELGWDHN